MKRLHAMILCGLLAGTASLHAQDKPNYKLGERLPQPKSAASPHGYKEIDWDALVPKNWDPSSLMKGLNLDKLDDSDPRAMDGLDKMRKAWAEAPVEPSLNGQRVRIAGFLVPLDTQRGHIKEFLLVPYFGACIHTPPPPANQTIHAFAVKPIKEKQVMSAVWVNGVLETMHSTTDFGAAGYRLKAEAISEYKK